MQAFFIRILTVFLLVATLASAAFAQHCPYDGGNMLVVELLDHKNAPIFNSAADLTLVEVNNPDADKCKYASGLITRDLRTPVEAFLQVYGSSSSDRYREMCPDCSFDRDGFYAVVIGQAERTCLVDDDGDGIKPLRTREYEVRFKRGTVEQTLTVKRQDFFSMCTGNGKWSRFQPVKFKLNAPEKPKA